MATKRQRKDYDERSFFYNNAGPNNGATPLPFFPYIQTQGTSQNHPFMTNSTSCNFPTQIYPSSNTRSSSPVQKRMRVAVDENGKKEKTVGLSCLIVVAEQLADAVVKRDDVDQTQALLNKLRLSVTHEVDELKSMMNGTPTSSGKELSDADTLHWMNNFLFLQIGYLSSFHRKRNNPRPGTNEGPWSRYATSLMNATVSLLLYLQEYNYQRHCYASKANRGHYQSAFAFGGNESLVTPPFQLSEVEIKECANVLSKVIRRTLDKMQYRMLKGAESAECMGTLRNSVEIFCHFQKCMYLCLPAMKSDENTISNLVRVVAEVSGNAKWAKDNGDILDKIASFFKALSTRTGFDIEQPASVLASTCTDVIRFCAQQAKDTDQIAPPCNIDENYAFFMDFLEKLRYSLRSRDDSVQQKWHLLFRAMDLMLKTATGNVKLIKSILTCLKYFAMSRQIVPFLTNDRQLVGGIAFAVTGTGTPNGRNTDVQQNDRQKEQSLEAMNCITALASKLVTLPPGGSGHFASTGCSNIIDILFSIAAHKTSTKIQSEVVKGIRLFIRHHKKEMVIALTNMQNTPRKTLLYWIIHIPANKKVSRSVKEAAITIILELLFSEQVDGVTELFIDVLDAAKELMTCEERVCEEQIVRILATKITQLDRLEHLADDTAFLSTMLDTAINDKQLLSIRQNAILIIKLVSTSVKIGGKLAKMEEFGVCVVKFLSFHGNGKCSLCRDHIIETIISIASLEKNMECLAENKDVMSALCSFANKLPRESNTSKTTVSKKSKLLYVVKELKRLADEEA